jgi:hypothetical protein
MLSAWPNGECLQDRSPSAAGSPRRRTPSRSRTLLNGTQDCSVNTNMVQKCTISDQEAMAPWLGLHVTVRRLQYRMQWRCDTLGCIAFTTLHQEDLILMLEPAPLSR